MLLRIPGIIPVVGLMLLLWLSFSLLEKNLKPAIMAMAESRANLVATETIHRTLYERVLADVNYNDLVYVHKDNQQHITMMQANTIKISRLVSQAGLEIKEQLKGLKDETLYVPLGQALGSRILANYGPRIKVGIAPVGSVNVEFDDEFQQAGINQVRHILYLNIKTTVTIVIPTDSKSVAVNNRVPIAETIIVGQVPSTYLGVESGLLRGKNRGLGTDQ